MYEQLRPANPNIPGESGGCLKYVRQVFGVSAMFYWAWTAWLRAKYKHSTRVMPNVPVPVWFSYRVFMGHVVAYIPGKGFYSVTKYGVKCFKTIEEVENYIHCKFVGWTEDIDGVRVCEPAPTPKFKMPRLGSEIQLLPKDTRTTFKNGTTTVAGHIDVTDNTFLYKVRGYDKRYKNRIIINSKSAGGNGVALALYYTNGKKIAGWKQI